MFHRVKSEVDNNDNEAAQPGQPANESVAVDDAKKPEIVTSEADETDSVNDQETHEEKEVEPMSQTEKVQEDASEEQIDIPASAYQRAGTAPASASGYPGTSTSYPGYNAANSQANVSAGDRRLTIGAGITMSGEIEACDYLLVEGTVEAALKGASVLDIAETGVFYGTVEIEDATIAGRFEGDITAQGRLVLREGATVTGTIAYKELEIEAGAIIDGKLTPLSGVTKSEKPAPSADKKETKAPAGKSQKAQSEKAPEPANNDGGLFSKAATAAE